MIGLLLYKRLTLAGIVFFSFLGLLIFFLAIFFVVWYGVKKQKFGRLFVLILKGIKNLFVGIGNFLFSGQKVRTIYQDKAANYSKTNKLAVPERKDDEKFEYKFAGWDKTTKKNGETNPDPIFIRHVKRVYVNVYDDDRETLLKSFEIDYGAGVDLRGIVPMKMSTRQFNFEFIGWDKASTNITKNTNIYAVYRAIPIRYNYKFVMDNEKTVVSSRDAIYGSAIIVPPDPHKAGRDGKVYEFVGWKDYKSGMTLTKDTTFVAEFKEVGGE